MALAAALATALYLDAMNEAGRWVPAPVRRPSRVGLEQELSAFDLPIARGTRYTLAPRADWSATEALSLRARASFHTLWLRGGERRAGLGDSELRLKLRVIDIDDHVLVQVGATETLPTGNAVQGLGNGAMVVSPFVTGGRKIGRTILYGYVSDALTLRNEKARVCDDYTDPSTNHETRNAIGVITGPSSALQVNATVNAITILTTGSFGETFLYGSTIFVVAPSDLVRIQLGGQLPLAGEPRFEWKTTFDVYFFL